MTPTSGRTHLSTPTYSSKYAGEIRLGVPYDIVYPAIPPILKRLGQCYPLMRINLVSSFTLLLKEEFARGKLDVILTTEEEPDPGAEIEQPGKQRHGR